MKKYLFLSLALLATAITGCKEDAPVVDTPTPKVTLEAGATTETTATFTVSSEDAQQVAYILYADEVPAVEVILADGTAGKCAVCLYGEAVSAAGESHQLRHHRYCSGGQPLCEYPHVGIHSGV